MIFLTTVLVQTLLQISGIADLRKHYENAIKSSKTAKELINTLSVKESISPIELGYLGSTQMIMAQHYFLPWDKLSIFTQGKENLEKAISLEPNNAELIYLRYTIQTNTPAFLHYNNNITNDRKMLEKFVLVTKDIELGKLIESYLTKTKK
ncbi:MAG: hypothetical protein ACK4K9_02120 [Bacteroidia bacterium]